MRKSAIAYKSIEPSSSVLIYQPAGECIYCGEQYHSEHRKRLGDEHVVAEGLGGIIVLPQASCGRCERITGALEQSILKGYLYALRLQQKLRRKKRRRLDVLPIVYVDVKDGKKGQPFPIPIDDYPAVLLFIDYDRPGFFCGRKPDEPKVRGAWVRQLNFSMDKLRKYGIQQFAIPAIDNYKFCRMLAKIAHSFAVAEIGSKTFEPLLTPFILDPTATRIHEWNYLVGGASDDPLVERSSVLHDLSLHEEMFEDSTYLIANICLFANLGGPIYEVIVGKMR